MCKCTQHWRCFVVQLRNWRQVRGRRRARQRQRQRGAGAGLGFLAECNQIRRHRHICRPEALAQSGPGGCASLSVLQELLARDSVGPSDGRGGVGGHGTINNRVEEVKLVLDLGRRRDDTLSHRAKWPRLSPTENMI